MIILILWQLYILNLPILQRLCTFQDSLNVYMLMEYVVGGELFSHLRHSGRFNIPTAKFYSAEVFLAIDYLHQLNIVYRDLKPEVNIYQ